MVPRTRQLLASLPPLVMSVLVESDGADLESRGVAISHYCLATRSKRKPARYRSSCRTCQQTKSITRTHGHARYRSLLTPISGLAFLRRLSRFTRNGRSAQNEHGLRNRKGGRSDLSCEDRATPSWIFLFVFLIYLCCYLPMHSESCQFLNRSNDRNICKG
jgi:hypothetical protein